MRVLYTYDIFAKQRYGGISRYVLDLARHLPAGVEPLIFSGLHINAYIRAGEGMGMRTPEVPYSASIRERVSTVAQRLYGAFLAPDIYHRTYYGAPFHHGSSPVVLTVYDMIHELYPEQYRDGGRLSVAKRRDCENADHIIAISYSTKNDLVEQFSIPPQKVSVVYLASTELAANPVLKKSLGLSKPYLLFVGQRGGYKNFDALLRAYASSSRLTRAFDLVCFGGGAPSLAEQSRINDLGLGAQVKFVAGADEDLRAYYEIARVFVYPSLYEGFGLPVLEAMQSGCPVLCAKSSSLPEVAGSAAAYLSNDFVGQLEWITFDDSELDRLKHDGCVQAAHFSWGRCAAETTAIYRTVLKC